MLKGKAHLTPLATRTPGAQAHLYEMKTHMDSGNQTPNRTNK